MTSVGVIAHSRKELGGGLGALRDALERARRRPTALARGPEEQVRAEGSDEAPRRRRRPPLRLGRRRHGPALRRRDRRRAGDPRDPPRGHREPLRVEPRHPAGPRGGRSHRVRRDASDARRRGRERRAVRGHGGSGSRRADDPRRRRRPEGPARAVRVRLHGRQGRPARARPCTRRGGWPALVRGPASCVLVGNVGDVIGGIAAFPDARPDDGRLDVGVVTAEGSSTGRACSARRPSDSTASSPFVQTTTAAKIDVELDAKTPYELDGGDRTEDETAQVPGQAGRDHGLRAGEGGTMSTANPVPETWQLTGDDAQETLAATDRTAARARTRSPGCGRPTGSVTRGRWRS